MRKNVSFLKKTLFSEHFLENVIGFFLSDSEINRFPTGWTELTDSHNAGSQSFSMGNRLGNCQIVGSSRLQFQITCPHDRNWNCFFLLTLLLCNIHSQCRMNNLMKFNASKVQWKNGNETRHTTVLWSVQLTQ